MTTRIVVPRPSAFSVFAPGKAAATVRAACSCPEEYWTRTPSVRSAVEAVVTRGKPWTFSASASCLARPSTPVALTTATPATSAGLTVSGAALAVGVGFFVGPSSGSSVRIFVHSVSAAAVHWTRLASDVYGSTGTVTNATFLMPTSCTEVARSRIVPRPRSSSVVSDLVAASRKP